MSVSKDIIKRCLTDKKREISEAVIVNRQAEFEDERLAESFSRQSGNVFA